MKIGDEVMEKQSLPTQLPPSCEPRYFVEDANHLGIKVRAVLAWDVHTTKEAWLVKK